MELSNKLLWFLIVLCFCITAPSCRALKKQFSKEKGKTESETYNLQTGKFTLIDSSRKDWSELIEYNFTFDPIEFPEDRSREKSPENQELFEPVPEGISPEAWAGLLSRVRALNVKISRQETEQKQVRKDSAATSETANKQAENFEKSTGSKESDSTIGANIPWFIWLIGAALIFGIFAFSLNKLKLW